MGNTISSNSLITDFFSKTEKTNNLDLIDTLDIIACNYIFTLNYENMKKLYDKNYCDKLVVLTSDIINNYYNEIEVKQLSDRISFGENFLKDEKIIYYQKSDITENSKQSNCNKIAKFYVKIGHLFSAILTTISPEYIYNDPNTGKIMKKNLQQKKDIPPGVKPQIVSNSLCTKRLNLLLQNQIKHPLNRDSYKHSDTLSEENGIPELMNLYLDSNYDFSTGLFTSMSPETELKYHKDLTDFYTSFTQEDIMPDYIKSFSDIKLKDNFKNYDITIEDYKLSNKSLIQKYAENIKNMIQRIDFIQQKLLNILNHVFIINEHDDNVRISHLLTETKLQKFIEE